MSDISEEFDKISDLLPIPREEVNRLVEIGRKNVEAQKAMRLRGICDVCMSCDECYQAWTDAGFAETGNPYDAKHGERHLFLIMNFKGHAQAHWTVAGVKKAMCYHDLLTRDEVGIHCGNPDCGEWWGWERIYYRLQREGRWGG